MMSLQLALEFARQQKYEEDIKQRTATLFSTFPAGKNSFDAGVPNQFVEHRERRRRPEVLEDALERDE
jgi:hypothetical protein